MRKSTGKEILEHADDDHRVLEAAERYAEKQARWHGRLKRALRPYGDDSTSVGDALHRPAADLGIGAYGRGFEALGEIVVAAETKDSALRVSPADSIAGFEPKVVAESVRGS